MDGYPIVIINFNPKQLGAAIIKVRKDAGMTQRELAKRIGIDESQVSRYEKSGYRGISIERADDIFKALGAKIVTKTTLPEK